MATPDTRSVSSVGNDDRATVPYARFGSFDQFIFSFFYGYKVHSKPISPLYITICGVIMSFQWLFLSMRRSDVPNLYFTEVYRRIGLYFDPSFYSPSFISFLVFFIIACAICTITISLGGIICFLIRHESGIHHGLHSISDYCGLSLSHFLASPSIILFTKPISCLITSTRTDNMTYCNDSAELALSIVGVIMLFIFVVFTTMYRFFVIDLQLKKPNMNSYRKGIFPAFLHIINVLSSFLCSLFQEWLPIVSSIVHILLFSILTFSQIYFLPNTKISGNKIYAGVFAASAMSGVTSLLMPYFNSLAAVSPAAGIILFYLSWIILSVAGALLAGFAVSKRHTKMMLLRPKYETSSDVAFTQFLLSSKELNKSAAKQSSSAKKKQTKKVITGFTVSVDEITIEHRFTSQQPMTGAHTPYPEVQPLSVSSTPALAPIINSSIFPTSSFTSSSSQEANLVCDKSAVSKNRQADGPEFLAYQNEIINALLRRFASPASIWHSLTFLSIPEMNSDNSVVRFVNNFFLAALKKEKFSSSAELFVSYALFLRCFYKSPQKVAAQLQKACDLYPGWTSRWLIWTHTKELEAQANGRGYSGSAGGGTTSGYGMSGDGVAEGGNSTMQLSSLSSMRFQMSQAQKHYELAKAHIYRMWSLLSRRVVDVDSVMRHAVSAIKFEKLAHEVYAQALEQNPDNPNVMRRLALLVRDVYSDDQTANELLHEADQIEEEAITTDFMDTERTEDRSTPGFDEINMGVEFQGITSQRRRTLSSRNSVAAGDDSWNVMSEKEGDGFSGLARVRTRDNRHGRHKSGRKGEKDRHSSGKKHGVSLIEGMVKKENTFDWLNLMLPVLVLGIFIVTGLFVGAYVMSTMQFSKIQTTVECERHLLTMSANINHIVDLDMDILELSENFVVNPQNVSTDELLEYMRRSLEYLEDTARRQSSVYDMMDTNWIWKNKFIDWIVADRDSASSLIKYFFQIELDTLSQFTYVEDAAIEFIDIINTHSGELFVLERLAMLLMMNVPMISNEEMKELAGVTNDEIAKITTTTTIVMAIFLALDILILSGTATIPLAIAILNIKKSRVEIMRQLCNIPADTASKMLEKIDGRASGNKNCSTRTANSSIGSVSDIDVEISDARTNQITQRVKKVTDVQQLFSPAPDSIPESTPHSQRSLSSRSIPEVEKINMPMEKSITPLMFQMMHTPQPNKPQLEFTQNEDSFFQSTKEIEIELKPRSSRSRSNKKKRKDKGKEKEKDKDKSYASRKSKSGTEMDTSASESNEDNSSESRSSRDGDDNTLDSEDSEYKARKEKKRKEKERERREKQRKKKEEEITAALEEDHKQMMKQREADVDKKLNSLSNIIPPSVIIRILLGDLLIIIATSSYYIVAFVAFANSPISSSQLLLGQYRDVVISQLSTFSTMLASKQLYPPVNSSIVYSSPKLTSHIFTSSEYFSSIDNLRSTVSKLSQFLTTLTRRYLLGTEDGGLTGDCVMDAITAPRTQGSDKVLDDIANAPTSCLLANQTICETRTSADLGGIPFPFYGISELIVRVVSAVNELVRTPEDKLVFDLPNVQLIKLVISNDLSAGISQIGVHLEEKTSEFNSTYSTALLVLFIVVFVLVIVFAAVFFLPLPSEVHEIKKTTSAIERLAHTKVYTTIHWMDELDTSVGRMDLAHRALVDTLSGLVQIVDKNEPTEKLKNQLDQLILYTGTHFADEEALMKQYKYPWKLQAAHKAAHVHLVRKVLEFSDKLRRTRLPLADVVMFATTWIFKHIKTLDQELGMYLLHHGKSEILSQTPNLEEFVIPPSVLEFFDSENVTMKEQSIFEETVARLRSLPAGSMN